MRLAPFRSLRPVSSAAGLIVLAALRVPLGMAQEPGSAATLTAAELEPAAVFAGQIVEAVREGSGTPGVSVAVGVGDRIVWSGGFGWADLEQRVAVTPATRFRIGSVSKPLTAAALGLLVDAGRLDLDAEVQAYVPDFPRKRWPITSRQVAGHLAGIRHYDGDEFLSNRPYETVREGLAIFESDSLLFEPGTRFAYSSYGWNLLSAVIEGASGHDFLSFMEERVFGPIGMRSTTADRPHAIVPDRARPYHGRVPEPGLFNAPFVDNSYKWAGGGFLSTPEDMVRFGLEHLRSLGGQGILRPGTVRLLWTSQRRSDGEETGYGIGWSSGTTPDGRNWVGHGGGSIGGTSYLLVLPERETVVAMATNFTRGPAGLRPALLVADAFLDPASVVEAPADGLPLLGRWDCTIRQGDAIEASGVLELVDDGGRIAGRAPWRTAEGRDEPDVLRTTVVHASSSATGTRLVLADQFGRLYELVLRRDGSDLAGAWQGGGDASSVACSVP
jgi:CubicO group peptidase (beta-lactamase class C family)